MHARHLTPITSHQTQRGFVLIVALVLLLVLTLLGLAAAQSTSLEQRMAGNARNHELAFQAAEAGLRAGYNGLQTSSVCTTFNAGSTGGNGCYVFTPPAVGVTPLWAQAGFWIAGNTLSYTKFPGLNLPLVVAQPQYIIEQMPPVAAPGGSISQQQYGAGTPTVQVYRITALGTGGDSSSTVMLQAVVTN